MDLNSFGALVTRVSGYNQLAPCAADAYNYEFGFLVFYCPDVPASQCVSTICADSASDWLAGMSAEASMIDCQSTNAASASVVFSNLCDANGVVIAGTTEEAGLPSTTVNVLLASPAASLTSTTPIQTASFLSTSILPAASSPNTPIQTQSTVSDSTGKIFSFSSSTPTPTIPNPTASTTTPPPSSSSNGSGGNDFNTSTIIGITFGIVGAISAIASAWYGYKMYKGWEQRRKRRGVEVVEMA